MGAWIEIGNSEYTFSGIFESHPTWVRGLKSTSPTTAIPKVTVAPYMGAWIEISVL